MAKKNKDFGEFLDQMIEEDPELRSEVEKERLNAAIAQLIYDERTKRRLTQSQMAAKIGTHQSVIARLEDADYGGHSLSMLWKIADAMGCRLKLEFEQIESEPEATIDPVWQESRLFTAVGSDWRTLFSGLVPQGSCSHSTRQTLQSPTSLTDIGSWEPRINMPMSGGKLDLEAA